MRPAGNDNKGAMKLRVDFKKKHTGDNFGPFLTFLNQQLMFPWRREYVNHKLVHPRFVLCL